MQQQDIWNPFPEDNQRWWHKLFPILGHIKNYSPRDFFMDAIAGIIIAVVLVPESIAYARLAGLPSEIGIYAAVVAYLVYALFGPSRQLVVAPVSIMSLMVGASLGQLHYNPQEYLVAATILALLVGVILFILGLFKGGYLENLLSKPVGIGFITAGAMIVATTQLPHLLGIEVHAVSGPLKTLDTLYQLLLHITEVDWLPLLIGVVGVAAIQLSKKISPFIPGALVNIFLGVAIMFIFDGFQSGRIAVVGTIPAHLPQFGLPWLIPGESLLQSIKSVDIGKLLLIAPGIALVNIIESLSIAKVMAGRNGDKINADRELISIGLANLVSSFFHGYIVAGSLSKTSVSYQAGTRSQLSGLVAVGVLVLVLLFLTPFLYYVPVACLGAIILVAAYHLFDYKAIKKAFKLRRSEGWLIVLTLVLTLLLGVDYGIIAGIIISFALFIWNTARPRIYSLGLMPGSETAYQEADLYPVETREDELIIKIDGPLYFANANYVEEQIINMLSSKHKLKCLILDARAMTDIDLSGEYVLWQILRIMILRESDMLMVGVNKPVMDLITASGFYDFLGAECFFASIPEAVHALRSTHHRSLDFLNDTQVIPAAD